MLVLLKLLDPVPVSLSGPEKQKAVSLILSCLKKYIIFLRPVGVLLLVQLQWDSIQTYNHLHLKELEIVRNILYFLTYEKIGLTLFCFSGPDMCTG